MAGLEIVEIVVDGDTARLCHDAVGQRAQFGELRTLDQPRDDQVAVAPVGLDLLGGKHAKP